MTTTNISFITKPIRLFLDSDLAISGTPSNSIFQIKPLKVRGFKVVTFNMFNTLYNVNSSNNLFVLTYNSTDYYVNLKEGFYTNEILDANIEEAINTQIPGLTVQVDYDPNIARFSITGFSSPVKYQSTLSTANSLLGITVDQTSLTLISNSIVNTNPLDYFYITSSSLSQLSQVIVPNSDFNTVILKIVVDNSTGFLVEYTNFSTDRFVSDSAVSLSGIDIGIVDKYFKAIPNQERWSMELSLDLVVNQTLVTSGNNALPTNQTQYTGSQTYGSYGSYRDGRYIPNDSIYEEGVSGIPDLDYR